MKKYIDQGKTLYVLMLAAIFLCSGMMASAQAPPPTATLYAGNVTIGGTAVGTGTNVSLYASTTDELISSVVTSTAGGGYSIAASYCATADASCTTTNTTDNKLRVGQSITFKVNGTPTDTPAPGSVTPVSGVNDFTMNLNVAGTCSDGIMNNNETGIDCGGECIACYSLLLSKTAITKTLLANASTTDSVTISNNGKNTVTGVAVSSLTLAGGNITVTPSTVTASMAANASQAITFNISVVVNTTEARYSGLVNVTSSEATNQTINVTVTVGTVTQGRRAKRYINITATGLDGKDICLGEPVEVTLIDKRRIEPIKNAYVDVLFGGKKIIFNLRTERDGKVSFTPDKEGDYTLVAQRSGYRDATKVISVASCVATTTTKAPVVVTTTKPAVKVTTTTKAPVVKTTTKTPIRVTTKAPAVTTMKVMPPPAPPAKKFPWTTVIVIIVVVVIVIIVATQMKGKPSEAAPAEEAKAPETEEESKE